jgi:hypothetical protein
MNYLKILEKCRDKNCGDIVSKQELESAKNEYIKSSTKECSKDKDIKKLIKCSLKVMKKSNFGKLIKKKSKCIKTHCKKEQTNFRNSFKKSLKNFRKKSRKNTKSKSSKKK